MGAKFIRTAHPDRFDQAIESAVQSVGVPVKRGGSGGGGRRRILQPYAKRICSGLRIQYRLAAKLFNSRGYVLIRGSLCGVKGNQGVVT